MAENTLRILAIDDNQDNLITLKAVLNDSFPGVTVFSALNGLKGIELALTDPPDVILLDIVMPGMDGFETCRRLKSNSSVQHIPVLFLTAAKSDTHSRIEAIQVGGDGFLAKPIDEAELIAQIRVMAKIKEANEFKRDEKIRLAALVAERTRELEGSRTQALKLLEELKAENEARRKTEEALRQSEMFLHQIVENIPDMIFVKEIESLRFVRLNRAGEQLLGHSRDELLGKNDYDLFPQDQANFFTAKDREVIADRKTLEILEEQIDTKLNGKRILRTKKLPILDEKGDPKFLLGISEDITQKKQILQELQKSEERYRQFVETANEGIWSMDSQFRTTFANKVMANMLGYEPEEMIGRPVESFMFEEDLEDHFERMGKRSEGVDDIYERKLRKKDGGQAWMIVSATALKDQYGNFDGSFAMFTDVTERKRIDMELTHRKEELLTVLDALPAMVWICLDPECLFIEGNRFVNQLFGVGPKSNLSQTAALMGDAVYIKHLKKDGTEYRVEELPLQMAIATGERVSDVEIEYRLPDGCQVFALGNSVPLFNEDGKVRGAVAAFLDITERKSIEMSLVESEQRYRAVVNNLKFGISVINKNMEILSVNPFMQYHFPHVRLDETQICYKVYNDLPLSTPCTNCPCCKSFQDGQTHETMKETTEQGVKRIYRIVSSPIKDEKGEVELVIELFEDITESRSLQAQLSQAQKMEAVGTLAGGLAHDFNNILQVVAGYSEMLLNDEQLPQYARSDARKINESAKRGADLVNRLLTFSRKADVNIQVIDLNARIKDLRKMLERTIPKMITIELSLVENILRINADPTQMDQIVMNLALNARDAMSDGGRLIFETANVIIDEKFAKILPAAKPGHHALLTVSDTGSGMDEKTKEHIFEPFFTTKSVGMGTGLGLAIVHGIVQQHGGHIICESELGHGTSFRIYFPALVSDIVIEEPTAISTSFGGTETILIVEDEEIIIDLCSRILRRAGYRVVGASNGLDALRIYKEKRSEISLVLLDLLMPEMGGIKCLEKLLSFDPSVKVVVVSGYSEVYESEKKLMAQTKGFIGKPFAAAEVLQVVRKVLDT